MNISHKIILFLLFGSFQIMAQNNMGIGTLSPDNSAKLDVSSTTQGVLIPRMTNTQITAIVNPANGLIVYNTTTNKMQVNSGTATTPVWQTTSGNGDNLGNHTATQNITTGTFGINSIKNLTVNGTATLAGNTYPTTTGTNNQVLATNGAGTLNWLTPVPISDSQFVVLDVSKTTTQNIPLGTTTANAQIVIDYNNVITAPTLGTWGSVANIPVYTGVIPATNFTANAYTVAQSGYYFISAGVVATVANATFAALPTPNINVSTSAGVHKTTYYGSSQGSATTFPLTTRGRGEVTAFAYLAVGDVVCISVVNGLMSSACSILADGTTHFTILKLN